MAIAIPDAHLAIGQPVDGETLSELPVAEIASTEPSLPMPVQPAGRCSRHRPRSVEAKGSACVFCRGPARLNLPV